MYMYKFACTSKIYNSMALKECKIIDIINSKCHLDKYLLCANKLNFTKMLKNKQLIKLLYYVMTKDIKKSIEIDESIFMKVFKKFLEYDLIKNNHNFSKRELTIILHNDICCFSSVIVKYKLERNC